MKRTSALVASLICSMMVCAQTREAAVLFSDSSSLDGSYLLTENVSVVFSEEGNACICLDGIEQTEFELDETDAVTAVFKDAFTLTADRDPDDKENYYCYSTFFSSECAYKLPDDGSVKAYIGTFGNSGSDDDVINLSETDTIHAGEAVILRVQPDNTEDEKTEITLMPLCNRREASQDNMLSGTDMEKKLGADDYTLDLGPDGVGFYNWNGSTLGANKAYLTLSGQSAPVSSFGLRFDDGTMTGVPAATSDYLHDDGIYNLRGQRIDESCSGLMIKNGQVMYK